MRTYMVLTLTLFTTSALMVWADTPIPTNIIFGHLANGSRSVGSALKGMAVTTCKLKADKSPGTILETYTIGQRTDGGNCYVLHVPIGTSLLDPDTMLRPGETCALFISGKQVSAPLSAQDMSSAGGGLRRIDIDLAANGIVIKSEAQDDWALYE